MKKVCLIWLSLFPVLSQATGMAVGLPNLYFYNYTQAQVKVNIANLAPEASQFKLAPHTMCKLNQSLLLLPFAEESNQFVVMVTTNAQLNPIVIDRSGTLTLASAATLPFTYSDQVRNYKLLGWCGNQLKPSQFLKIAPLKVVPLQSESGPPLFNLSQCSANSNFMYFINDKPIKKLPVQLRLNPVKPCQLSK